MNWAGRIGFSIAVLAGAGRLLCAAPADQARSAHETATSWTLASDRTRVPLPPEPFEVPPVPVAQSPVMFFRELLAMSAAERRQALTNRAPENQKVIMAKVREYAAMDPDRREERLQATEMRWYLQPLLTGPATNRAEQLASIPVRSRQFVADRLREWDKLPPDVQKDLLANKDFLIYLTETVGLTSEQRRKVLDGMTPVRRQKLQAGIEQWSRMPEYERRKIVSRFNQFFDLTPEEKQRALQTLSGPERRQIEKTLKTFENLPPDQRARCARAIEKYTSLSLAERQQFLKNADRWKTLTPNQRQAWRDLVNVMPPVTPPPLPPDFPPLPPSHAPSRRVPGLVTNGN
jgi:Protein of unknown function (DUF3106)